MRIGVKLVVRESIGGKRAGEGGLVYTPLHSGGLSRGSVPYLSSEQRKGTTCGAPTVLVLFLFSFVPDGPHGKRSFPWNYIFVPYLLSPIGAPTKPASWGDPTGPPKSLLFGVIIAALSLPCPTAGRSASPPCTSPPTATPPSPDPFGPFPPRPSSERPRPCGSRPGRGSASAARSSG